MCSEIISVTLKAPLGLETFAPAWFGSQLIISGIPGAVAFLPLQIPFLDPMRDELPATTFGKPITIIQANYGHLVRRPDSGVRWLFRKGLPEALLHSLVDDPLENPDRSLGAHGMPPVQTSMPVDASKGYVGLGRPSLSCCRREDTSPPAPGLL